MKKLLHFIRPRMLPHAIVFYVLWPFLSCFGALYYFHEYKELIIFADKPSTAQMILGAGLSLIALLPEFIATASLGWIFSITLFGGLDCWQGEHSATPERDFRPHLLLEPLLIGMAGLTGILWEYPAVFSHPLLSLFPNFSVIAATFSLTGLTTLCFFMTGFLRRKNTGEYMVAAGILLMLFFWGINGLPRRWRKSPPKDSIVLMGIDSLSQLDDVSILRETVRQNMGHWYEYPVTPGLLTNVVWTSVVTNRHPDETRIVEPWQAAPWETFPFNLVAQAKKDGFVTWSYFSKQAPPVVTPNPGFDFDRGSPMDWRHLTYTAVMNASVFLPVIVPRLPIARAHANLAGTFAYDIQEDIHSVLTTGMDFRKNLVAAHLEYLHDSQYPPISALSRTERAAVWRAPIRAIKDLSLHYQYPEVPYEPLKIYRWKIHYLQKMLAKELTVTKFLAPANRNRLIMFSDHGTRRNVWMDFCRPEYHRVVLATFGITARDAMKPISLLDIGQLAGFDDRSRPTPADPAVYYSTVTLNEWGRATSHVEFKFNGQVKFDEGFFLAVQKRLSGCHPYAAGGRRFFQPDFRRK